LATTTGFVTGGRGFSTGGGGTVEQAASNIDVISASARRGRRMDKNMTDICHSPYELQPNEEMLGTHLCDERFTAHGKAKELTARKDLT
jgi:hypothetical protein